MEIRELRAFTVVVDEGSLTAAARRLHLSQSALSQTILSLERQLGVPLLRRYSTGVAVTDAGMILLREARALLAQHDRALAAVTSQAAAGPGPCGWVSRLSCPAIFCRARSRSSVPRSRKPAWISAVPPALPSWSRWRQASWISPSSASARPPRLRRGTHG